MNTQIINIDKRVEQYVRLRDEIKRKQDAFKAELAPYVELLDKMNGQLLEHLTLIGSDSASGPNGTVYRTLKKSATLADAEAFRAYVKDNEAFDLIDWKVNKTAAADFVDENGVPPPGVNYSTHYEVGVRRGK